MNPKKTERIAEIKKRLEENSAFVLTDYRGLTVFDMAGLRDSLRNVEAEYKVVKNTLARRAARELELESLAEMLSGPMAISFSNDPVAAVKAIKAAIKDGKPIEFIGGYVDGNAYGAEDIEKFADIPTKDVLIATLLSRLNGPIYGLANVAVGPLRNLVYALNQIAEQKSA